MSDLPADLPSRVDLAMKEMSFEVSADQPRIVNNSPPNVFSREYSRGSFKYLVTITGSDIARHGADKMIAINAEGAKAALGWQNIQKFEQR